MKRPVLLALVSTTLLLFETGLAYCGGHHGPPGPPVPPPPPPPPPPPHVSAVGAPSNQLKTGTATGSPSAGKASAPSGPATGTPAKGTVTTGGIAPKIPAGAATGMAAVEAIDYTTWEYWWLYNKDAYLDVKRHIEASATNSGVDATLESARAWDDVGERILPELMKALEANDDFDPTISSLIAVARVCDGNVRRRASEVATAVARRQNDPNRTVAEGAIMALGILGSESSVPELCGLLRDTPDARRKSGGAAVPERTRAFAALALGLIGERTHNEDVRRYAVHYLTQQLSEADSALPDTHAACSIALGMIPLAASSFGDASVPGGRPGDVPASGGKAGGASAPGGKAGDGSQAKKGILAPDTAGAVELELLLGLLKNDKAPTYVRAHLPQALARLTANGPGRERVARALLERLADANEKAEIVQGCTLALGAFGDADSDKLDVDVRTALSRQSDTGDVQARCFALVSLAQNAGRGEVGPGVDATRARLIQGLDTGRARERTWSALALGILEHARNGASGPPEVSVNALGRAMREARSPDEVGAYSIACGLAGVKAATLLLIDRLGQVHEARALGYVQVGLGLLHADEAVAPLNAMLVESRTCSEKLPQTALALTLLEDPLLVSHLLELLSAGTSQSTLGAAAEALGAVGDRRAVDPLLAIVHDAKNTPGTRAAAIAALGRICDRDALPWQHAVSTGLNYRAMTSTLSAEDRGGLLDLH